MVTQKINSTVLVLYLMIKYHDRRNLGSNGFIMTGPNHSPSGRKSRTETHGRNQEAGPGAEANEEHCLLACCLWLMQLAIFYTAKDHLSSVTPPKLGCIFLNQLLIITLLYKFTYRPIWLSICVYSRIPLWIAYICIYINIFYVL